MGRVSREGAGSIKERALPLRASEDDSYLLVLSERLARRVGFEYSAGMASAPEKQPLTPDQQAIYALVAKPTPAVVERAAAFRAQLVPGRALPYLAVRPGLAGPGLCPSCGEPWQLGGRCLPCKAAAHIVAEEFRAAIVPSAPAAPLNLK